MILLIFPNGRVVSPRGDGARRRGGTSRGWMLVDGRGEMPELPEVESARAVIERKGLRRRIVDVDDSDTFVCRPHAPGEIRHALLGGEFTSAMRRGKSMWCQTGPSPEAVTLGI